MPRLSRSQFCLALVAGLSFSSLPAAHAQEKGDQEKDITGTWQGTLDVGGGRSLRTVLKISKDDAKLKGVFYSIDQGGTPIPVTTLTQQGNTIKLSIVALGGTYEGKLTPDASEIDGLWTQGSAIPLNLKHVSEAAAWTIPEPPPKIEPMAANADPAFEVATIKPSKPDAQGKGFTVRGTRFATFNTTLNDLITFAYGVQSKQVVGEPGWVDSDKFDIDAKPDTPGTPNDRQLKVMVKKLLVERFQLKFHEDKKELSVYALVPGKTAPKLTQAAADAGALPGLFFRGLGQLNVRNATMEDFCGLMQTTVLDRPVVDQTGLTGRWDFTLNWTPDESQFGGLGVKVPPPSDKADAPPPLFTAIQEQMGLKLDPTKAQVKVLVIDKVEKPSDN
jgi:uncharacterized protein (TIGR03435 family)